MLATAPTITVVPAQPQVTVLRVANSNYGLTIAAPVVTFKSPRVLRVANAVT
jgi:hypothetical protein